MNHGKATECEEIMAMDASSQRDASTIAQINVTPLVDVMLVLLVIFMVTAPIIQQGVQVNLPQAKSNAIPGTEELLVVTVAKNGDSVTGKYKLEDKKLTVFNPQGEGRTFKIDDNGCLYDGGIMIGGKACKQ